MNRSINIGDKVICTESGVIGLVKRFYKPTACEEQTVVKTEDCREYHAPTSTWIPYTDGIRPRFMIYDEFAAINEAVDNEERINTLLNSYGKFIVAYARNHNIGISEAMQSPACKARAMFYNAIEKRCHFDKR